MDHIELFDRIAPVYSLFYQYQRRMYRRTLDAAVHVLDLAKHSSVIDMGCGTGAFASVLFEHGFSVTGVDASPRMIEQAERKTKGRGIEFICSDILTKIPVKDSSFDIAICSYVAHGLKREQRYILYREMCRVSRHLVIIHDYTDRRSFLTDFIEKLEGGDYFNFINETASQMEQDFCSINVIPVGKRSAWYVCEKKDCGV